jgi:hypothetical protein
MPYEKTIGSGDYTFNVTLTATPTSLINLLSVEDKQELMEALYLNGDPTQNQLRVSIDGWLLSASNFYTSHKVGGAEEDVTAGIRYPMPVYQWHERRLFRGFQGQLVTVRILLSHNNKIGS